MTTSIEHDEYGRVDWVKLYHQNDFRVGWSKLEPGRLILFFEKDGWREVPQPRNVTGECDHGDEPFSVLQVPDPSTGHWKHLDLPTGLKWRKDRAIVLPGDWVTQLNIKMGNRNRVISDGFRNALQDSLDEWKTPVLTIWEGER